MNSTTHGRSTNAAPPSEDPPPPQKCDICGEETTRYCRTPCGHIYCSPCLHKHIKYCIAQEMTFPVSCCGKEIPFDDLKQDMSPHLRRKYNDAAEQYTVPSNERVFCAGSCGLFLGSSTTATKLLCEKCKQSTCTACKAQEHEGGCTATTENATLKALAQAKGWQVCAECSATVELSHGCNHITCRCGHQFCYLCGATWKTCQCQQFNEQNLQEVLANDNVNENANENANEVPEHRHYWYPARGRAYCPACRRYRRRYRCHGCPAVSCGYSLWW